jgi:NAD(P)-dependent dehydrogenase (short-subunit alcohol dehydrogenase family)
MPHVPVQPAGRAREDTMLLAGKAAVISGGAGLRGIGFATASLFAAEGARVAIIDKDADGARAAAAQLGPDHLGLGCDVTDRHDCKAAAESTIAAFCRVDILVNNAGITQKRSVMEIDAVSWPRIIDVNLTGVLNLSQALIPHMIAAGGGAIACMSSVAAQRGGGIIGGPHYAAAKAGVLGLAKAMARELGPQGIRVNCVAPGLIDTDIIGDNLSADTKASIAEGVPLARLGRPQDVAGAFLFLCSDLSAYSTGTVVDVNGGMLIH